jgi:hypothetical protein
VSGWRVCSLCAVVLIPYRTIVELLIEHFEFGWRKPARGEKSILYSQVMLGISDKHVVLPSRVVLGIINHQFVRQRSLVHSRVKTSLMKRQI